MGWVGGTMVGSARVMGGPAGPAAMMPAFEGRAV